MSKSIPFWLQIVLYAVVGLVLWRILGFIVHGLLQIAIPVLVVGGIGYVVYRATCNKALTGGRRTLP